jgi:hypothetical protein
MRRNNPSRTGRPFPRLRGQTSVPLETGDDYAPELKLIFRNDPGPTRRKALKAGSADGWYVCPGTKGSV